MIHLKLLYKISVINLLNSLYTIGKTFWIILNLIKSKILKKKNADIELKTVITLNKLVVKVSNFLLFQTIMCVEVKNKKKS